MSNPFSGTLAITFCAGIVAILGFVQAGCTEAAQTEPTVAVPFVGCPADGQGGPIAAPETGQTPVVSASVAARLAYYASEHLGVLAPKGWHCFSLYGSNGNTVFVTPEPHDPTGALHARSGFTGPAVQLSLICGETSGRFEVAQIAARIFPIAKPFVQDVINEGIEPPEDFPSTPYPYDKLMPQSPTEVEFETPGNAEGLGTRSWLTKNEAPIDGVATIFPDDGMNIVMLTVRLPPEGHDLSSTIIQDVEKNQGAQP